MTNWLKTLTVAFAAVILTIGLAACGSSSKSTSSSASTGTSEAASTSSQATEDVSLGEKAGKAAGAAVSLPQVKAGILNLGRVSESGARAEDVMNEALGKIGWQHVSCDAAGNPAKMSSCGETLLNIFEQN